MLKIESFGRARSTHRAAVEKSRLYIRNYGRVIDPALPKTQAAYFPAGKAGFPMAFVVMRMRNVVGLARLARRAKLTLQNKKPRDRDRRVFLERKSLTRSYESVAE